MRIFSVWLSGVLTLAALLYAADGSAWHAVLDTFLACLNLYIGTRK